jgi:hypothetical protein
MSCVLGFTAVWSLTYLYHLHVPCSCLNRNTCVTAAWAITSIAKLLCVLLLLEHLQSANCSTLVTLVEEATEQ